MRLICPHCMSGVVVSDDAAGTEATCPKCGKSFPTPARYAAAVVPDAGESSSAPPAPPPPTPSPTPAPTVPPPSAPPGYVSPPPPPATSQRPSDGFLPPPATVSAPAGYTKSIGFTLSPRVIAWLPVVFLTLTFALTMSPWVSVDIAGTLYSQGPWGAMFRKHNPNRALERLVPPETIVPDEKLPGDWLLMLPYLLLLILAMVLAWADRLLQSVDPQKFPPPVAKIWPSRHLIIAGLSVAAVVLVFVQSMKGFGLERAVRQVVRENPTLVDERKAAEASEAKEARLRVVEYKEELELAKFNLSRTIWMHLAVLCNALAAFAVLGYITLEKRGDKPPPKVMLHY